MTYKFDIRYFTCALILLIIEIIIAIYIRDAFVRPYLGDFLVVILVFTAVKSFFQTDLKMTLIGVLLFAYLVEISQYFHFIEWSGLASSALARTILGTSFAWTDLLMYTLGIVLVWFVEVRFKILKLNSRTP